MKPTSKLTLLATAFAVACMFTVPALRAADAKATEKKAKEPEVTAAVLKKYDANKDGKLDEAEMKAWKADLAKKTEQKAEKKEEKKEEKKAK